MLFSRPSFIGIRITTGTNVFLEAKDTYYRNVTFASTRRNISLPRLNYGQAGRSGLKKLRTKHICRGKWLVMGGLVRVFARVAS
jgi:hypothetical protein